jgi:hypothetical protein
MPSIFSYESLLLAWRRLSTGRNIPYKRFYRPIYIAYEIAHKQNLRGLCDRLKGSWQPQKPDRIYLPKPSGLQRPITLLRLEDQIVLQAIANYFAKKLSPRRKKVEHNVVFSNILGNPNGSIFFIDEWHISYVEFQSKCEEYYRKGLVWMAHFDLAAYYDTICHQRLIKLVAPNSSLSEPWPTIQNWLRCWTTAHDPDGIGHGIPQGPIAADFLAECMLLPLDEKMLEQKVGYVRYVDDIRIFAKSEIEAQRAAVQLEVFCRSRGLIPQGKKFAIKKAESLKDAFGSLPSIRPNDTAPAADDPPMSEKEAERLFTQSLGGRPLKIEDKTRARYVLFRAPRSNRILGYIIKLLARHPEHIDAFVNFLANYERSPAAEKAILNIIRLGTPYGYVRGELYHVLARIASKDGLRECLEYAKNDLRDKEACIVLRWGAMALLLSCERMGICKSSKRIRYQPAFVQAFLSPIIPESEFSPKGTIPFMLTSQVQETALSAVAPLYSNGKKLPDLGLKLKDVNPLVQNTLKEMGLVGRRFSIKTDQISDILVRMYDITPSFEWRSLLGPDFIHALSILIQAERMYLPAPSNWLQFQNSFNDAVLRRFLTFLLSKNIFGGKPHSNKFGSLIDIGVLLDPSCQFSKTYPLIANCFREINARRNKIPGSHPYDKKTGQQTTFLKSHERNRFALNLKDAFNLIISIFIANK